MIMGLIDQAIFGNICKLFKSYGIDSSAKLIWDEDAVTEYRKFNPQRSETETTEIQESINPGRIPKTLILYSRSPVTRNDQIGNNYDIMTMDQDDKNIYFRESFNGECDYTVSIVTDSNDISDLIEFIYAIRFERRPRNITMSFHYGEDDEGNTLAEDASYYLTSPNQIQVKKLSNAGNLISLDFSFKLQGIFFLLLNRVVSKDSKIDIEFQLDVNKDTVYHYTIINDTLLDTPDGDLSKVLPIPTIVTRPGYKSVFTKE